MVKYLLVPLLSFLESLDNMDLELLALKKAVDVVDLGEEVVGEKALLAHVERSIVVVVVVLLFVQQLRKQALFPRVLYPLKLVVIDALIYLLGIGISHLEGHHQFRDRQDPFDSHKSLP